MGNEQLKVLLVEDNPIDVRLIEKLLRAGEGTPFDLESADCLSKALERLDSGGVDIVLLDLGLPDSQGMDTFLKLHEHLPKMPVVILTNLDDEELAKKAVRKGAQDFLSKGKTNGDWLAWSIVCAVERQLGIRHVANE